ncbi:MAG: hypothetical protein PHQ54_03410, partial [Candidatus Omnitrophica bacterium]|nr:hypothetical protein [Candidatus Omnitrophota bacterium]
LSVKGPSGAILIFISLAVFTILIKNPRPLKVFFNPLGILIVLAAGGFWYLLLIFEIGWAEFLVLLHRETLGRFQEGFVHREPFYYYLPVIFAGFLPWSLILFGVKKSEFQHDFTKFMAVYAVVVFLFFSFCKSKLPTYVLSIFPALSVISSGSVQRLWSNRTKIPLFFFIILTAVALVLIYLPLASMSNISGISFPRIALMIFLTAFPLLLISGLKLKYQFFYLAMVPLLIYAALVRSYGYEFSDYRSAKNLFIRQQVKENRIYSWGFFQPSLAFYSRSIVDVINSSQELKDGYLVVRKKDLADLKSNLFNFFEISQTQKYILFEVQKLQNCNIIKDS